jgi:catechol 2,3-dioxygenase-like lactoylglutathione lyase family enzyme
MSSSTAVRGKDATTDPRAGKVAMKLEVISIPVSDVERAKEFYLGLGWRLDADFAKDGDRAIQVTPPGSPCSVHFGTKYTSAAPGSAQNSFLVVSDIQAARAELAARGVEVSEVFHFDGLNRRDPGQRMRGPSPDWPSYGTFVSFRDPDGNGWLVQEVTTRLPGRVDASATTDLASALRRAAAAHGEHEERTGGRDENWPDWYAAYMVAEQAGTELPT